MSFVEARVNRLTLMERRGECDMNAESEPEKKRSTFFQFFLISAALLIGTDLAGDKFAEAQQHETVKLLNYNSSKYLAVRGADRRNGGNVFIWDDIEQRDILWKLHPQETEGPTIYKIENVNSQKFLAIGAAIKVWNGGNVVQWQDIGQRDILWELQEVSTGCYKIRNVKSDKYLAVIGGLVHIGLNVIQYDDVGQKDIVWCKQPK